MKRWRATLIVVGVFLALLAYVLLVEREREPPPAPGATASPTPAPVLALPANDLRAIQVGDGARTLRLARTDDGWTVDGRPADAYAIDWRIDQLAALPARLIVAEQVDDLATYGLADPALTLTLELASGAEEQVHIGRETPDGTARYVQRAGDPRLYIVEEFYIEAYLEWLDQPPDAPTPTPAP